MFVLEVVGQIEQVSARRDACQRCHVIILVNCRSRKQVAGNRTSHYQLGGNIGKEKIVTKREAL